MLSTSSLTNTLCVLTAAILLMAGPHDLAAQPVVAPPSGSPLPSVPVVPSPAGVDVSTVPADSGPLGSQYQFYHPAEALHDEADQLVATLDGRNVYLSAVGDAYNELPDEAKQQPFDLAYPTLLEGVVSQVALVLEAQRRHLDDNPDVRRQINRVIELTLANAVLREAVADKVTDAAIMERYRRDYGDKKGLEELRLSVIVTRSSAEAERVQAQLAQGSDFAALARQVSIDPSGVAGGAIGYVRRDQLPPVIGDAVFGLPVGAVSPRPLLDGQAWELFKVEDRRTAPVPTFAQAKDGIRRQLIQEVIRAEAIEARAKVRIQTYNADGTAFSPPGQELLDTPFTVHVKVPAPK